MFYVNGKCAKTRELNHYRASRGAILIYDHAVMNYRKKYFRTQNSDKTAGFGSDIARIWIWIWKIRNSKVPIPKYASLYHVVGIFSLEHSCLRKFHVIKNLGYLEYVES